MVTAPGIQAPPRAALAADGSADYAGAGQTRAIAVLDPLDRHGQPIAALAYRFDHTRLFRPVIEQAPQFPDCTVQHIVGDEDACPDARHQLFAGDDLAGPLGERDQHLHDLRLDLHGLSARGDTVQRRVDDALVQPEHFFEYRPPALKGRPTFGHQRDLGETSPWPRDFARAIHV